VSESRCENNPDMIVYKMQQQFFTIPISANTPVTVMCELGAGTALLDLFGNDQDFSLLSELFISISTRRFIIRPQDVSLVSMGFSLPSPLISIWLGLMPFPSRKLPTMLARNSDNFSLYF
jgi:hypothetical protein